VNAGRQRRSARLSSYDYGQAGAYFVTICTRNRQLFFDRDMIRTIAERCWLEIPDHFPIVVNANRRIGDDNIDTHRDNSEPDAIHGRDVQLNAPTANNDDNNVDRDPANRHSLISPHRNTLAVIVRTYKAAVTTLCRREGHAIFQWQRSYYERIVRDDADLYRTRQYIIDNPANWNQDEHHAR